jgi:hypothetical protein
MSELKDRIIELIQRNARRKLAALSSRYIRAKPEEREAVQAGIQFERWMAETCQEILDSRLEC